VLCSAMHFNVHIDFTRDGLPKFPPARQREARAEVVRFLISPGSPSMILTTSLTANDLVNDAMVERYLALVPPKAAVIPEFQTIINEIERAYVLGMFFSAVSASCVSIERMLNLARIELNIHHPKKIKKLWRKGPSNDWDENIEALEAWGYLDREFAAELASLYKDVRCQYLHSGEIKDLPADALRSARAAYRVIDTFLGFHEQLFCFTDGRIQCLDETDPRFVAFYKNHQQL
jgi:hypothetical protein